MRVFFGMIGCFLGMLNLVAQVDGTKITTAEYNIVKANLADENASSFDTSQVAFSGTYIVDIYAVSDTFGENSLKRSDLDAQVNKLNSIFSPAGIAFKLGAFNVIADYNYARIKKDSSVMYELIRKHASTDKINVYLCNQIVVDTQKVDGFTYYPMNIDSNYIFMNVAYFFGKGLITQLGHYMGLMKTNEFFSDIEPVDGSGCTLYGDLLCDTYPGPAKFDDACNYTGDVAQQGANRYYTPSVANYMAESNDACKCMFSLLQYKRMYYYCRKYRSKL